MFLWSNTVLVKLLSDCLACSDFQNFLSHPQQMFLRMCIPQNADIHDRPLAFCLGVPWGQGASFHTLGKQTQGLLLQLPQEGVRLLQVACRVGDIQWKSGCYVVDSGSWSEQLGLYPFRVFLFGCLECLVWFAFL